MHPHSASRAIFCLLLAMLVAPATSTPVAEPDPAPIDPHLAAAISNNLNLACQQGCNGDSATNDAHHLNANAALGSAVSPLSVLGGLVLASSALAAI